ncbi:MAG: hypothetical protein K5678_05240 [Acetatifactor sp.]|nr:hypothetical protein [Acetatifactor sp.]
MKKKNIGKEKVLLIVGILLVLAALGIAGLDIYHVTQLEHVESTLKVIRKSSNSGKHAYVTYDYQGTTYYDKVLSSYNAFTMKNGKSYTVLIDASKPDQPHTTSFVLDIMMLAFGVICVAVGVKRDQSKAG